MTASQLRPPWPLFAALLLLSLPAALLPGAVADAAALHALASGPHPYFVPAHGWLIYAAVPAVVLSAIVLFMAPGLLLTLGLRRSDTLAGWLLSGFGVSLPIAAAGTTISLFLGERGPTGSGFGMLGLGIVLLAGLVHRRPGRRDAAPAAPTSSPGERWGLGLSVGIVLALTVLLLPKFFWEDFNGDGVHAFLSSRLLLTQGWPFWPSEAGPLAAFPGVTSMLFAWPNAWFLRLFGESEAAVRLPFLLYLPILAAALVALAEHALRPLGHRGWTAIWAGLMAYTLAMAFSATYNPYHADLALPATQDTLLMICVAGWMHASLRGEWGWTALFATGTAVSLPSGPLLMGLWLAAQVAVVRPRSWKETATGGAIVIGVLAALSLLPKALSAAGVSLPGEEYDAGSLARYFEFLQFTDWRRLGYMAVPAGLFPALILAWWRGQDSTARALTLVTVAYFLFFFVQAHIALHHFVPAMLLPVVVAARAAPVAERARRRYFAAWQAGALVAVALSIPLSATPHTTGRQVGGMVSQVVGNYAGSESGVFRAAELLTTLIPLDWDRKVPDSSYGGSPIVWLHYAQHGVFSDATAIGLAPTGSAPPGMYLVETSGNAALYVRDPGVAPSLRALRPAQTVGARAYSIPRGILWRGQPLPDGPRIYSLESVRRRLGRLIPGARP